MALIDALRMTCRSDVGMVRDHNEDYALARPELGIAVLADGMGGYNAGEVASEMAVAFVASGLMERLIAGTFNGLDRAVAIVVSQEVLREQFGKANAAIYARAHADAACEGMGTTLVACLFHDDFLTVAHIGDSRLYRLRADVLEQITRDHSLLQKQIDAGMIGKEEARLSNHRNFLMRAVGVAAAEDAEIHTYDVAENDLYLLCTDGLSDMLADEEIQATLLALHANLDLTAEQLIWAANDAGGSDNVSVILVHVAKTTNRI